MKMLRSLIVLSIGMLCGVGSPAQSAAESSGASPQQIEQMERDYAKQMSTDPLAATERYEADEIVTIQPGGFMTDKTQDKKDIGSGDLKFESIEISDLKASVFGNTAVARGLAAIKGTYKKQPINGNYRFTDTWVKRNGKWQVVASEGTEQHEDADSKQLMQIENEFIKADESGNPAAWEKYLADDYVVKGDGGKMWDKAGTVQSAKAEAKDAGSVKETISDIKTAILGNFALVMWKGDVQMKNQHISSQFADVFRKDGDGWKLAARTTAPTK